MPKRKEIGFIGLGKMGMSMASRLRSKGWRVAVYDIDRKAVTSAARKGMVGAHNYEGLTELLAAPRTVLLMVPSGKPVDDALSGLKLEKGDLVIDGGNSYYKDSMRRAKNVAKKGVSYLDTGISGGPVSIKMGRFAIMAGGDRKAYRKAKPLFDDLSDTPSGYMGPSGAGHFAKMVHNGIEYGMMQSLAEGFTVLKKAPFPYKLSEVAEVYNHNSIITSRLVGWLKEGFEQYGEDLAKASGAVAHTGEGEWTVKTAKELKVRVPVIEQSFRFRLESARKPSYTGKILSTLRAVFGGHAITKKKQ